MFKVAVTALLLTTLIASANAATGADWKLVAKALDAIPTAAGMTVLKRRPLPLCGTEGSIVHRNAQCRLAPI